MMTNNVAKKRPASQFVSALPSKIPAEQLTVQHPGRDGGAVSVLRSAVPFLAFLAAYGLNGQIRVLPRAADSQCVTLHNVSALERRLFAGIAPHLIVASFHCTVLDFLSALPYLIHYLIPVAFPLFLFLTGSPTRRCGRIAKFYWLIGWSMWAHYAVWFLLPTAPPWVADNVAVYRRLNSTITPPPLDRQPREGCAFHRVDQLTGVPLFRTIFSGNPVPFASFPSGHVAWPTCVLISQMLCGCSIRRRILLAVYVVWVAWATMYSCHHHLSDIVAAVFVVAFVDRLITCVRCHGRLRGRRKFGSGIDSSSDSASCLSTIV